MDLFSIKTIKELLKQQETTPRKGLGQNFLTSKGVLGDILKAAGLTKSDTVLEIGAGVGTLTRGLAQSAKKVIAVEKDPAMVKILKKTTEDLPNIEIIQADILKNLVSLSYPHLSETKFKVVANLPYYITSPVIRLFLSEETEFLAQQETRFLKPKLMVFMVQKEVAQRICAKPPDMTLLAVSVQVYGKPSVVSYVKKGCFWPQPKVDSAILKIIPTSTWISTIGDFHVKVFWSIVKAGFKQPRKQLLNNLSQGLGLSRQKAEAWLNQVGIAPTQRAETLTCQDWIKLAKDYTIDK